MRKFFAFLFVFLLIAAGAGYLLYPTVSDQIGQANDAAVMRAYGIQTQPPLQIGEGAGWFVTS